MNNSKSRCFTLYTSLVPRLFVEEMGCMVTSVSSNCVWIQSHQDYSCTYTSHEYWIMHVIFENAINYLGLLSYRV